MMNLSFDTTVAQGYKSPSQIARRLTESWVERQLFCPRCGAPVLHKFPNNAAAADFFCSECQSQFELKSHNGKFGTRVVDGTYAALLQRIQAKDSPDFLLMEYSLQTMRVESLCIVPKFFLTPEMIERRAPLPPSARRQGWVGSNILLRKIPLQGRIGIVSEGQVCPKEAVLAHVRQADRLYVQRLSSRGWLLDVLQCVNAIPTPTFTLSEMYAFEEALALKHPENTHIRDKIRQQLQVLRDRGVLRFVSPGRYQKSC